MNNLTPLERHKADLQEIISLCRNPDIYSHITALIARLVESMLSRLPEESNCPNHLSDEPSTMTITFRYEDGYYMYAGPFPIDRARWEDIFKTLWGVYEGYFYDEEHDV